MMKEEKSIKILSIICVAIVMSVIVAAFIYRIEIEQFALSGYIGVFVACFAATATILLPAPGIFVVIQYAQFLNPVYVVLLGGLGASIGEMIGYLLGRSGQELVKVNRENKMLKWLDKKTYLTVFLFSLIPLPIFDIVGIAAGVNKTNPLLFWICCFLGKTIKITAYVFLYAYAKDILLYMMVEVFSTVFG